MYAFDQVRTAQCTAYSQNFRSIACSARNILYVLQYIGRRLENRAICTVRYAVHERRRRRSSRKKSKVALLLSYGKPDTGKRLMLNAACFTGSALAKTHSSWPGNRHPQVLIRFHYRFHFPDGGIVTLLAQQNLPFVYCRIYRQTFIKSLHDK